MEVLPMKVKLQRLHSFDLPLPSYMTSGASGMDLYAAIDRDMVLNPGQWALVPTGIALSIPPDYEAQIRPRSGLALKHGLTLLNSPGTIDADYRGEIKLIVINLGPEAYILKRGERLAQMVFARVERVELVEVDTLEASGRGQGGFGHTGV